MHELSLAQSLVDAVCEVLETAGGGRVVTVRLKIGALAGVVADALQFCYEIVTKDTPLEGSQLLIQTLPVAVFCPRCERVVELPGVQRLCCPVCDTPTGDLRQGRELELESVEIVDPITAENPS